MFFIYPTAQYPRKALEYVFKSLYLIANLFHVMSLVVLIADFYTRLSNSMPYYYRRSDLVISDSILLVMEKCTYTGSIRLGNVRGQVDVTVGNIGYGLMTMAQYVTALFVLEFLLLVNNSFSALNYSKGNRHLRLFGVHVPLYHITMMMTQVYSIAICVVMWSFDGNRRFFQDALRYCAREMANTNYAQLVNSEYDDHTIFSTAVYWPFAATCMSELIYLSGVVALCWFSSDEATVLLSEADAPWESRGAMCNTAKPLLKLHTAQRNAIIEDARHAIKEGQKVRIVRSYQLMTEEDFEALVQAMREQVAKALKEKQFEKLKENFGDHESQIDNLGFQWRENMMAPPPPQDGEDMEGGEGGNGGAMMPNNGGGDRGPTDQFIDVPFEDYFTDNEMNDNARNLFGDRGGPHEMLYPDEPMHAPGGFGDGNGDDAPYRVGDEDEAQYPNDDGFGYDQNGAIDDGWSPSEGANQGELYDPEMPSRISHSHHRRRHRHSRRRSDDDAEEEEEDAYGGEPDPRVPATQRPYDHGRPSSNQGTYEDADDMRYDGGNGRRGRYNGGGSREADRQHNADSGRRSNRRESARQRPIRGRQAEIEQENEQADALSGDSDY